MPPSYKYVPSSFPTLIPSTSSISKNNLKSFENTHTNLIHFQIFPFQLTSSLRSCELNPKPETLNPSAMKRSRQDETLDLVNCLMLLSREPDSSPIKHENMKKDRVFVCKTCNREFPSFQALGGHRASHKKPKLMPGGAPNLLQLAQSPGSLVKPKTHECPICGLEFAIGQALGGHMRRHRDVIQAAAVRTQASPAMPVLKKSNSSKRVSCLNLDLNLDLHLAPPGYHQYDLTKLQLIS